MDFPKVKLLRLLNIIKEHVETLPDPTPSAPGASPAPLASPTPAAPGASSRRGKKIINDIKDSDLVKRIKETDIIENIKNRRHKVPAGKCILKKLEEAYYQFKEGFFEIFKEKKPLNNMSYFDKLKHTLSNNQLVIFGFIALVLVSIGFYNLGKVAQTVPKNEIIVINDQNVPKKERIVINEQYERINNIENLTSRNNISNRTNNHSFYNNKYRNTSQKNNISNRTNNHSFYNNKYRNTSQKNNISNKTNNHSFYNNKYRNTSQKNNILRVPNHESGKNIPAAIKEDFKKYVSDIVRKAYIKEHFKEYVSDIVRKAKTPEIPAQVIPNNAKVVPKSTFFQKEIEITQKKYRPIFKNKPKLSIGKVSLTKKSNLPKKGPFDFVPDCLTLEQIRRNEFDELVYDILEELELEKFKMEQGQFKK